MSDYKFFEKAPEIDYALINEHKVEKLYDEIDELLSEAEFEVENFFDPNYDIVTGNLAKVNKLVSEIERFEEPNYEVFEERYAALDNWVFDMTGWAPDGDEDVLGWI